MKRTPLYPVYSQMEGVRLVDFGGWELPVQFKDGILAEHHAVRQEIGLFDVSHMGEFLITGPQAESFLNYLVTSDISTLQNNQAKYGLLCYPHGGVVDDVLVYRFNKEKFWVVVNAGNREKDFLWVTKENPWVAEGKALPEISDISDSLVQIALQGPKAVAALQKELLPKDQTAIGTLNSFDFLPEVEIAGSKVVLSRTGYTGEDGFEIYIPADKGAKVWDFLLKLPVEPPVTPCGLGCRDTLRLESKMPLYGHELSSEISPLEANLSWAVALDKENFCGKEALVAQKAAGIPRSLRGIIMKDKAVPREGNPILLDGTPIGVVTSGAKSPTGGYFCALVLIQRGLGLRIGDEVVVEIRGKERLATLVKTPFYKRESKI